MFMTSLTKQQHQQFTEKSFHRGVGLFCLYHFEQASFSNGCQLIQWMNEWMTYYYQQEAETRLICERNNEEKNTHTEQKKLISIVYTCVILCAISKRSEMRRRRMPENEFFVLLEKLWVYISSGWFAIVFLCWLFWQQLNHFRQMKIEFYSFSISVNVLLWSPMCAQANKIKK